MAAPRAGNLERGWNDPPVFDYQSSSSLQASPRKTVLNKRVAYPSMTGSTNQDKSVEKGALLNPMQGPPKNEVQLLPPTSDVSTPMPVPLLIPTLGPVAEPPPADDVKTKEITISHSLEDVLERLQLPSDAELLQSVEDALRDGLTTCSQSLTARAAEDVRRKLQIMRDVWKEGKLSVPVRCRMGNIVEALRDKNYREAWDIHQTLMVDYTAEVHLWLVGVKRIIHELKQTKMNEVAKTDQSGATKTSCDESEAPECKSETGSEKEAKTQDETSLEKECTEVKEPGEKTSEVPQGETEL